MSEGYDGRSKEEMIQYSINEGVILSAGDRIRFYPSVAQLVLTPKTIDGKIEAVIVEIGDEKSVKQKMKGYGAPIHLDKPWIDIDKDTEVQKYYPSTRRWGFDENQNFSSIKKYKRENRNGWRELHKCKLIKSATENQMEIEEQMEIDAVEQEATALTRAVFYTKKQRNNFRIKKNKALKGRKKLLCIHPRFPQKTTTILSFREQMAYEWKNGHIHHIVSKSDHSIGKRRKIPKRKYKSKRNVSHPKVLKRKK